MAICTGQYISVDMISFIMQYVCLLNQLNGEKLALFLPEARCAFLIVAALQFFAYQLHNSQKSYQGKNMSFLCTAECHLEHNTLLL